MAWNFDDMVAFGRQFDSDALIAGAELAFVFSEWTAEGGLALTDAYPAVRTVIEPENEAPTAQANRIFVDLGSGWQQLANVGQVQRIGIGKAGVLTGGIYSSMVVAGWQAKGIGVGYVVATGDTLDSINADRTTGVALMRTYVHSDAGDNHPLAPDTPFTAGQVTALGTWINNHGVTNTEFASLFDVTPSEIAAWLTTHARAQFAKQIEKRFSA